MATRLLSNPHQYHHHHHHSRVSHPPSLPPLQPHHGFLGLRSKFKGIRVNAHFQQQQQHINTVFYQLGTSSTRRNNTIVVRAVHTGFSSSLPLVSPSNHWGIWSILLSISAFGIWSEKSTNWGRRISGALTSTLVGLFLSNIGVIASDAPAYTIVNQYLLPLSVPLLLFSADLNVVIASTGRLLLAFCLGSAATVIGTLAAWKVVPLQSLGNDGWKIAAALMSRHIGGAINYVAVSEAFGVSSSAVAAGLAADNLICAVYFTTLFALASKIPKESFTQDEEGNGLQKVDSGSEGGPRAYLLQNASALALSSAICTGGVYLAKILGFQGGNIPCITVLVVLLATLCPSLVGPLAPAGETLAILLIQVFFVVVGANASISSVMETAPYLFVFCFVQIAIHLLLILGVGKLLGFEKKQLLMASNANVGGPTTAAGLATAKGWKSLVVPGILVGIFGVAVATFISIFLGITVLKHM